MARYQTGTAILLVQFRPHSIAPAAQAGPFAVALLARLRTAGWADPIPVFVGDPVDLPAAALVEGAAGSGLAAGLALMGLRRRETKQALRRDHQANCHRKLVPNVTKGRGSSSTRRVWS